MASFSFLLKQDKKIKNISFITVKRVKSFHLVCYSMAQCNVRSQGGFDKILTCHIAKRVSLEKKTLGATTTSVLHIL